MLKFIIPSHLGIDTPEEMPLIELISRLREMGYRLVSVGNGNMEAMQSIDIDKPEWDNVCAGCQRRKRQCVCSHYNSDDPTF